ncbi:Uncharacterized protein HZ326_5148 [Fusarium oxysporum f. sp. albedinis]|nr:Uncharacterized protein HZ326_5148 [Fusarium oxysporum f. sp. albedinis]
MNGLLRCLSYDGEVLPRVSVYNTGGPQFPMTIPGETSSSRPACRFWSRGPPWLLSMAPNLTRRPILTLRLRQYVRGCDTLKAAGNAMAE